MSDQRSGTGIKPAAASLDQRRLTIIAGHLADADRSLVAILIESDKQQKADQTTGYRSPWLLQFMLLPAAVFVARHAIGAVATMCASLAQGIAEQEGENGSPSL